MYKIQAQEGLSAIQASSFPHLKEDQSKAIIDSYTRASSDIMDIIPEDSEDYSGINDLKNYLTTNG